ncbi:unnamed protein product [Phytophthora fragariaefolia]|uniref:Unnamed protein product n=1 Tax=Phytophthora fragariaefolia TaxID=1490495 RepID=A0A9W6TMH8_9STRA|nr:unnamed protein product [Phytophthora fragariaefolia]
MHLQAQLKKEDPELWRSIEEHEEAASQKEQTPKKKKKQVKGKKKKKAHGARCVGEDAEGYQVSEGATGHPAPTAASAAAAVRMRTRHMGARHVPVQVVHAGAAPDPRNYREAMRDARAGKWKVAIKVEFESLERNNTWEVVVKPRNSKLLHTMWVFKTKTHADGTVERYKGRLVVCGIEQKCGVDYIVTFSAVLGMTTGKLTFVMAHVWGGAGTARGRAECLRQGGQGGGIGDIPLHSGWDGDPRQASRTARSEAQGLARAAIDQASVRP